MSKRNRPRSMTQEARRRNRDDGRQEQMLHVSIADINAMKCYLEELLGAEQVANLSLGEVIYLASLVHEDLPDVPPDLAPLMAHQEQRQFERAQVLLAMRPGRNRRHPRRLSKGTRQERAQSGERMSQHSFLDDDTPALLPQIEAFR